MNQFVRKILWQKKKKQGNTTFQETLNDMKSPKKSKVFADKEYYDTQPISLALS